MIFFGGGCHDSWLTTVYMFVPVCPNAMAGSYGVPWRCGYNWLVGCVDSVLRSVFSLVVVC